MTIHAAEALTPSGTSGDLFRRIARGESTTRSALSRATGLAPSTVSLRIDRLLDLELIEEVGAADSRGGRRARSLAVNARFGCIVVIDFGVRHARLAIADMAGRILLDVAETPIQPTSTPADAVQHLWAAVEQRMHEAGRELAELRGIALGVPAPIAQPSGRMISPAFMPSWNNVSLPDLFDAYTQVPVVVENDANLFALAELAASTEDDTTHLIAVKLGTRIGSGLISGGRLHRGHNGAAGEISHTAAAGDSAIHCSCSVPNCLESVASGGAIIARLKDLGVAAETTEEVVALTQAGQPDALSVVRDAGTQIGAALSGFVNFINPNEVVLGGAMSTCAPLVASIRAELFRSCLPAVTADLVIRSATTASGSAVLGGIRLLLDIIHSPARIDQLVLSSAESKTA